MEEFFDLATRFARSIQLLSCCWGLIPTLEKIAYCSLQSIKPDVVKEAKNSEREAVSIVMATRSVNNISTVCGIVRTVHFAAINVRSLNKDYRQNMFP